MPLRRMTLRRFRQTDHQRVCKRNSYRIMMPQIKKGRPAGLPFRLMDMTCAETAASDEADEAALQSTCCSCTVKTNHSRHQITSFALLKTNAKTIAPGSTKSRPAAIIASICPKAPLEAVPQHGLSRRKGLWRRSPRHRNSRRSQRRYRQPRRSPFRQGIR